MENASKALLIAAAVLIVVLLVAFGMRIFNQAQGAGDAGATAGTIKEGIGSATVKLEQAMLPKEVREFNAQFNNYLGVNKTPADVMACINKKNEYKGTEREIVWDQSQVNLGGTDYYRMEAEYDKDSGYIKKIIVYNQ